MIDPVTMEKNPDILPVMALGRRDIPDCTMAVLVIVPADETFNPLPGGIDTFKALDRIFRAIFKRPEQGFGIRIVIAHPRAAVGRRHTQVFQPGFHGEALLRRAVIRVKHRWIEHAILSQNRSSYEVGAVFGAFQRMDFPADDFAAVDIHDHIQVKEHASYG